MRTSNCWMPGLGTDPVRRGSPATRRSSASRPISRRVDVLGLTATLVREDGMEEEVFSLIGPKRYDALARD